MDSYISVIESIKHAAWFLNHQPNIEWLSPEDYEKNPQNLKEIKQYNGIIVPGGFGKRGIEGKISVIQYCREHQIPFLGLCLGMQLATIEFARHVCGLKEVNSTEFNPQTKEPVIDIMPETAPLLKKQKNGGYYAPRSLRLPISSRHSRRYYLRPRANF